MNVLEHPQPVGAFGFPAGLFLIDTSTPDAETARQALVAGRVPTSWPDELRGLELAHADDLEAGAERIRG